MLKIEKQEDQTVISTNLHWSRGVVTVYHRPINYNNDVRDVHVNYSSGGVNSDTPETDLCDVMVEVWKKAGEIVREWEAYNEKVLKETVEFSEEVV